MSEKVYCSSCDGSIGIGKKWGICQTMCQQWFDSCSGDNLKEIELDERAAGGAWIDFIVTSYGSSEEQFEAVALGKHPNVTSAVQFCEGMGFDVAQDNCYDGVPVLGVFDAQRQELGCWHANEMDKKPVHKPGLLGFFNHIFKTFFSI